jgi:rare lipoprotein A
MSVPLAVEEREAPRKIARICSIIVLLMFVGACGSRTASGPSGATRGAYKVGSPYTIDGVRYYPKEQFDYVETGVASWYGPGFHGKSTANGERYDQRDHTAAHRTLQMPAMVRVTNLDNGLSTVVRVNDRGPYARSRIIDLSRAAAEEIGMIGAGTARVRVEQLPGESQVVKDVAINGGGPSEQRGALVQLASGRRGPLPTAVASPAAPVQHPAPQTPPAQPPPPSQQPVPSAPTVATIAAATPAANGSYYVQTGAFSSMDNAERQRGLIRSYGFSEISPASASGREVYRVRLGPYTTSDAASIVADRLKRSGYGDARVVVD